MPTFSIIWVARIISGLGDILFTMSTMWYVLTITDSPLAAAIVPLVPLLTFAILGIPLGTLSDRYDKKKVLILTDLFRALLIAIIGFLMFFDSVSPGYIYLANLGLALAGFMFNPALQSVIPSILPTPINSLHQPMRCLEQHHRQ